MFIALLLSSSLLMVEPAPSLPNHPLTMSEVVTHSLANNPDSKIAWWNAKRAAACVGASKSAFYPKLDLDLGASHGKQYKFINGPSTTFTATSANLVLSMMLFDFGERSLDVEASKKALDAANWEADFALQSIMITSLELAYSVLHRQEVVFAARISKDDAAKMLDAAEALVQAGFAPVSDVFTSKASLCRAQMSLTQAESALSITKAKLAQSMGYSAETEYTLAPLSAIAVPKKETVDVLIERAKKQRLDLLARSARLKSANALLEKSYVSYLPQLSFTSSAGFNHFHHDHTKNANYNVGLNLRVPLFSGFDSIYNSRIAYADTKTSLSELAKLELDIATEVLEAKRTHEAASSMLVFAKDNIENARLAYDGALERYKAGRENMFQETSSALGQLAEARLSYSEVKTQWLTSLARLAYATGAKTDL